ncbi:hypothetical protein JOF53_002872 [Crossiella equi]|uniref:Multifunctional cyclase-dehydratase-3-O-methyl transferase tcmN n=1 Tax=Crossiella equi TaxID=130796 RepID=A0ABS5ABQ1_9PSEU|nr:methyltransferase [Crossiella equi]MBP2474000.1 hypothetical protein [Crossiella equi]
MAMVGTIDLRTALGALAPGSVAGLRDRDVRLLQVRGQTTLPVPDGDGAFLFVVSGWLTLSGHDGETTVSPGQACLLPGGSVWRLSGGPAAGVVVVGLRPQREEATRRQVSALTDLASPYAMRVAATLRLADHVEEGVTGVAELAAATNTEPGALRRLLRYLACRGVFREEVPDHFVLTDSGQPLRAGHPSGLRDWLDLTGAGGRLDKAFTELLHTTRTGEPGYAALFGRPFWADLAASPELATSFNTLMRSRMRWYAEEIAAWPGWQDVHSVVDVGGGDGTLLAHLLLAHHDLCGTVVELDGPAAAATAHLADAGLSDRATVIAGSFFDPLPGADILVLSWVLRDWDDEDAVALLRRCADHDDVRILVVEPAANAPDAVQATARDLRMLTAFGGQERTEAQLRELAHAAGLRPRSEHRTPSGLLLLEFATGSRHRDAQQTTTGGRSLTR